VLSSVTLVAKVFNRCIGKQVLSKVIWEERIALTQLRKRVPTPIVYNGTLQIHPKLPKLLIPPQRSPPNLIHPSLDRPHSPSQTASTSNQPFCHSTLSGPTDRHTPTGGLGNRSTPLALTLAISIESDALIIWAKFI